MTELDRETIVKLQKQLKCCDAVRVLGLLIFIIGMFVTIYGGTYYYFYGSFGYIHAYYVYNTTDIIVGSVMMLVGIIITIVSACMHSSIAKQLPKRHRGRFMIRVVRTVPAEPNYDQQLPPVYTMSSGVQGYAPTTKSDLQYFQETPAQVGADYPPQYAPPSYEHVVTSPQTVVNMGDDQQQQQTVTMTAEQ